VIPLLVLVGSRTDDKWSSMDEISLVGRVKAGWMLTDVDVGVSVVTGVDESVMVGVSVTTGPVSVPVPVPVPVKVSPKETSPVRESNLNDVVVAVGAVVTSGSVVAGSVVEVGSAVSVVAVTTPLGPNVMPSSEDVDDGVGTSLEVESVAVGRTMTLGMPPVVPRSAVESSAGSSVEVTASLVTGSADNVGMTVTSGFRLMVPTSAVEVGLSLVAGSEDDNVGKTITLGLAPVDPTSEVVSSGVVLGAEGATVGVVSDGGPGERVMVESGPITTVLEIITVATLSEVELVGASVDCASELAVKGVALSAVVEPSVVAASPGKMSLLVSEEMTSERVVCLVDEDKSVVSVVDDDDDEDVGESVVKVLLRKT
jgi:hypothetical protein